MTHPSVAGVWKLRAYSRRFLDTGEVRSDMLPHAYIIYTPAGHMMSVTVEENRVKPAAGNLSDADCVRLFRTIVSAYAGRYSVADENITHDVELSWNEAWTGTRQVRRFSLVADTMTLETTPRTTGDNRLVVNTLTWERVEAL